MSDYLFELIKHGRTVTPDKSHLENRPFVNFRNTFEEEAPLYYPGEQLELAINTAIAVGEGFTPTLDVRACAGRDCAECVCTRQCSAAQTRDACFVAFCRCGVKCLQ